MNEENNKEVFQTTYGKQIGNGLFKCEQCGKEHDGSYGSGRFCSKKCHSIYAGKLTKNYKGKHQNHDKQRSPYGTWKCERCNLIFEARAQLFAHNHEVHPIIKGSSWNKGLTKETDKRVAKNAKHVSESVQKNIKNGYVNPTWTKEYWTEEKRKCRSESKKKLYKEHPEKHPNRKLANNRTTMNYPEKVAYDWLIYNNIQFEHQKEFILDNHKRFVDFFIPNKNLFIEIDGEYWHPEGNDSDRIKDEISTKYGFKTLRIRPKNNITKQLNNYFFGGVVK